MNTPWYVTEGERGEQLLAQGQIDAARAVFERMLVRLHPSPSYTRAVALAGLARCAHAAGRFDLAEQHLRQALEVAAALASSDGVKSLRGTLRSELGDALRAAGRYDEARDAYEAALATARELKEIRTEAIELGRLGALAAARSDVDEASVCFESARRLFEQVSDTPQLLRCLDALGSLFSSHPARMTPELARYAPVVFATMGRLGTAATYGRAVLLGHLGRCWAVAGQPDLAVHSIRDALDVIRRLPPSDDVKSLAGFLNADLGDMLRTFDREADARRAYEAALALAGDLRDLQGRAIALQRLGRPGSPPRGLSAVGWRPVEEQRRADNSPQEISVYDEVAIDHVFDPDLLIEGPRQRRTVHPAAEQPPEHVRPTLVPSVRTWVDEEGVLWFSVPFMEPRVEGGPTCTLLRRRRRELELRGRSDVVWRVIRAMDGERTVADILSAFTDNERRVAARLLGALGGAGVIDVSGRPLGRFVHLATKKGVLPGGGLEGEAVLRLATDGNYRVYPDALRIPVGSDVPQRLRAFHALTRARRSTREYRGGNVARADFDALLHTACGVTGRMTAAGGEVQLRAYPSSGALYAIEIYPVVFRVEGVEPAVYHYRPIEQMLEVVRSGIDPATFVRAALPIEREMVGGAAALICLTGCFRRHERKYGEGGYRMLVAETGHISQNLVLAATALGLSARPFGGVFDDLLNQELGIDPDKEQFLLAVLLGLI
jgi:SagB-type dehydrogenase family enzyme